MIKNKGEALVASEMAALKNGKETSPSEDFPKGKWEKRWNVCQTFEIKNRQAREFISVASASAWGEMNSAVGCEALEE